MKIQSFRLHIDAEIGLLYKACSLIFVWKLRKLSEQVLCALYRVIYRVLNGRVIGYVKHFFEVVKSFCTNDEFVEHWKNGCANDWIFQALKEWMTFSIWTQKIWVSKSIVSFSRVKQILLTLVEMFSECLPSDTTIRKTFHFVHFSFT